MSHRPILTALLALATAAACDRAAPPAFTATGTWFGDGGGVTVQLTLAQHGDRVSGSGSVVGTKVIPVTAAGSAVMTDFRVTLSSTGYEDLLMYGSFTGRDEIEAYLAGSGFFGEQILLHRQ